MCAKITGTGSYIPTKIVKNSDFINHEFFNANGEAITTETKVIVEKFQGITGIEERRYASDNQNTSDLAFLASEKAIKDAGIDKETIDYIICAHNFGDVKKGSNQSNLIPGVACKVKQLLQIKNPKCVAYDILFGCPGWVEGMIQANAFIKAGIAKKCLVIGAETLSRIIDKHDRDAMIFADGAGATIIEESIEDKGIIAHETVSCTIDELDYLGFGKSYKEKTNDTHYIKMQGRKIYEFALTTVPQAMKACLDKSGYNISDVKKIFLHQANEKMDEAILKRFYRLYKTPAPEYIMPMNIQKLGNSSVATVPTLYDMVKNGEIENQKITEGEVYIFASVGAGMHINAFVYKS
jgi:3-oxoacyl-[acyl-carrier-protein] synthase-3